MTRSFILFSLVALVASRMATGLSAVARADDSTAAAVVQDNFDDNKRSSLWNVFGSATGAAVTETNKRLQFTTSADANETFVGYVSNKWWLDPGSDFRMKASLYFDVGSGGNGSGWVALGFTPNSGGPADRYVMVGIGRSRSFLNYWWELNDDWNAMDFAGRTLTNVTFYVTYDAASDVLHISDTGYGAEGAWQSMPDFLATYYGDVPLYVFLGVTTQNLAIPAGKVYLDDFEVAKGNIGSPYDDGDNDDDDDNTPIVAEVEATVAMIPSTIKRKSTTTKVTAVIALPKDITLADWDEDDLPTLLPGKITASAQKAFLWVDKTVRVMASFSKSDLLDAVTTDGETELYISGTLADGRTYAGSCTVTIK
ncbi:MAG: hypothetical protein KBE65_23425 [Phycisphaerae bacterium]|nr:hypothetical protein [Phycisphaerae bacterium]